MLSERDRIRLAPRVQALHALGPRPLYEFLAELTAGDDALAVDIEIQLDRYTRLDPTTVEALDGRVIRLPLALVEGGRR